MGTVANIVQSLKLPDGNIKVLVEGIDRGKILKISNEDGYFRVTIQTKIFRTVTTPSLEQLVQRVTSLFEQYVKLSQSLNYETMIAAIKVDEIGKFTDTIAANLNVSIEEKQELLEIFDPVDRLTRLADILDVEIEKLNVDRTIQGRVKRQMERAQREYYLNEKIKAIQKELGRNEKNELEELKKKIETAGMTKDALEHAMAELKRLEMMPPMSAESTVSRNYLDWLLAVPWKKKSKEIRDISRAQKVLEEDHYGLEKIKERILEFLAVRQLVKNPRGSILCFVGPPANAGCAPTPRPSLMSFWSCGSRRPMKRRTRSTGTAATRRAWIMPPPFPASALATSSGFDHSQPVGIHPSSPYPEKTCPRLLRHHPLAS